MQHQTASTDQIREFVIAGHGNLNRVKEMLDEFPELLNVSYEWNADDHETAIQGAAQVGSVAVAEFLLSKGAPLDTTTCAMMGREEELRNRLDQDPEAAKAVGAHGIPLLPHAVWSGNLHLVRMVHEKGGKSGADLALHNAITRGQSEIVQWLLENANPDPSSKNYQGKTPIAVAAERKNDRIVQLLKMHGATD